MGKTDDKGEPVKTVRIGGREVEVPIIFILPEESGEKEIERYEHPKVHIKKEDKAAESKEEPLEELTDGKLEEVEKPKDKKRGRPKKRSEEEQIRASSFSYPNIPKDQLKWEVDEEVEKSSDKEETPYLDMLSDKPKKKKKPVKVSYRSLFDKGYGKAQALRRSVEEQKKRGAKTDDELTAEKEKKVPKGQHGMLNYDYLFDKPNEKDYLTDEEGDEIEKSWEKWLKQKDALDASENTGEFKQWGKTPDKRSGRDPETGRTKIDYLQDMGVYSAGGQAMGKREPQTSRGQADDATQSRLDRYSGRKYHPRQSGGRDSMDLGRLSQHENVLLSPSASDTGWAEGRERKQPKELWDDGER